MMFEATPSTTVALPHAAIPLDHLAGVSLAQPWWDAGVYRGDRLAVVKTLPPRHLTPGSMLPCDEPADPPPSGVTKSPLDRAPPLLGSARVGKGHQNHVLVITPMR